MFSHRHMKKTLEAQKVFGGLSVSDLRKLDKVREVDQAIEELNTRSQLAARLPSICAGWAVPQQQEVLDFVERIRRMCKPATPIPALLKTPVIERPVVAAPVETFTAATQHYEIVIRVELVNKPEGEDEDANETIH